jgi:uncharacterized repeat protein (TIGR01451 family)
VTLEIASGPIGGTILGTTTVNALAGTATFTDIRFTVPGTYTLRAKSTGVLSAVSNSFVISATTADAPTITSITNGDTQLSVVFTAPANDGGSAITTYQYSLDGGAWVTRSTGTTASPLVITGLTNGTTYSVRIRAVNGQGSGTASNSMSGTPGAAAVAPVNVIVPVITGVTTVGQLLTTTTGTWTGVPTPTYTYQWRRCDALGSNCTDIASATAVTYTLVAADAGSTIRVVVTGTNAAGSATGTSLPTALVLSLPLNTVLPSIGGTTIAGQTLSVGLGVWTGTPAPTYTYQWQRCDAAGSSCIDILNATAATYVLDALDVGATLRISITGTNLVGNATAVSLPTGVVTPAPVAPSNTAVPTISGTTQVGQLLTASPGTWTGVPSPTLTYQWRRCDASGNGCSDIASATATTYTLVAADTGGTIRVVVTGTNASGNASATSSQTSVVTLAPANTVAPTISGTAQAGQVLTANPGTWTGSPSPTLTYQWRRCDAGGANCVDIGGVTASTYTAVGVDVGSTIRVVVTGTNSAGIASATSAATGTVAAAPAPPANTGTPSISGTTTVGQTLTANPGTWTGNPSPAFAYQWRRCDVAGNNCTDIGGATGNTYVLTGTDAGSTLRVVVTGTNASGSAAATSAQTAAIASPPANTVAPTISGTAQEGQTLTANNGTWTGVPSPTFTYQWRRCDVSGNSCVGISGGTASTYVVSSSDVGGTIRVAVTGTNTVGSATAVSAQTGTIAAASAAPANSGVPTISGTTQVGQVLTATPGTWIGNPSPTFSYQWRRCDPSGNSCIDIAGAAASTYLLGAADVGATIRVVVTGTNSAGSATGTSPPTAVVTAAPSAPSNTGVPTISGSTVVGQTLTANPGTWTGNPTPALSYQWQRCDAAGANCADIVGATSTTYVLTGADGGRRLRVVVTGTNASGSASAQSAPTAVVTAVSTPPAGTPPVNIAPPTISGTMEFGQVLTANPGSWTGTPDPSLTYQWQRCDTSGNNCVSISGATGGTYTPTADDVGRTIRVVVTGTNGSGSASAPSGTTSPVGAGAPSAARSRIYVVRSGTNPDSQTDSVPADGTLYSRIRIELRDAAGNLRPGRAADLVIGIEGMATATPVRETATPGIYELELRSTRVNLATVSVTIDGSALQDRPVVTFVQATADLDIKLSASTETPQVGQSVVVTIEVTNLGPHSATGVEVEHAIGGRFRFVAADASRGQYDSAKGVWTVGGLSLNEKATLRITVIVTK